LSTQARRVPAGVMSTAEIAGNWPNASTGGGTTGAGFAGAVFAGALFGGAGFFGAANDKVAMSASASAEASLTVIVDSSAQ
jgi:hypothetical protein